MSHRPLVAVLLALPWAAGAAESLELRAIPMERPGWCHPGEYGHSLECWMDQRLLLAVPKLGVASKEDQDLTRAVVYINDTPFPKLPIARGGGADEVVLELRHMDDQANKEAWASVLGDTIRRFRPLKIALRLGGGSTASSRDGHDATLVVFRTGVAAALLGALVAVVVGTIWLGARTKLLRDASPGNAKPTFSLARTQMAVWFVAVMGAFLFIWAVTGRIDSVTTSALVLMGIGGGTAMAATVVDRSKQAPLRAEEAQHEARLRDIDALCATTPPPSNAPALTSERAQVSASLSQTRARLATPSSEGFLMDILSDGSGISFPRFQMLVWTMVLGLAFLAGVVHRLAMPDLGTTLLGLMGISAGTYIGFKIPD